MFRAIEYCDGLVLNCFERLTQRLQLFFGIDNFWLAKHTITLYVMLNCITFGLKKTVILFPVYTSLVYLTLFVERMTLSSKGLKNFLGQTGGFVSIRFVIAVGNIVLAFSFDGNYLQLCFAAFYYLVSCTPLPPGESRV